MKASIHPQYNPIANVVCSCGNSFTVGSTKDKVHVELCNKCHPFYTGQQRFVDSASRIEKFRIKQEAAKPLKTKKDEEKEARQPQTLREMLEALKK
ncbi:MAG: 50S ribosomal protein L31 [Candidatus Levybacteria bacterium CG_4_10_14_0_2_um_filter_36_16]|nr:MAG: 50S ribosomal protein L31 [Candidatus Levybacteria bacterium CG2_30_37_29]PIR79525.1 MAG: 50S ribosomal protein L31 [Candidatus Levybacteria bacterium CG10_big_fil_rev_8_21_14_0_10_36_30]PIZ97949.1 MAG: 50S ribosomal protein L31 [Candidatus Levybacteria bacterium CG_4_10_14_0_2_um_filter_36_16]PJA90870.1 MAG: 50S ribosomal protein L31 [Candidatus Levybacteria bacterium CG_4_9_14_3_um_filter_36_7]